ncbi:hypothetical protein GPECTOR_80g177 [Gonium pectorale]|uniref:TMEM62 C-terminal domain-containing protein n=1 Tax=Gonium pectorale TaxID=33097 RepID=A0A150G1U0_GONPE|nr:hypothetical protein GPECTOR_80g177 [Gonium pectorale]|eukprot:KXZ43817.1 hypothetical protein GPECTOR_80g177 [Gonium pectorale]
MERKAGGPGQAYHGAWKALSWQGGVPEGSIFDIRGNHDTFNSGPRCPVSVLVGVDASLDPGMRSPTNFLGVVPRHVLVELDQRLADHVASMRSAGCSPTYIAYGHYPLSTIAYVPLYGLSTNATAAVPAAAGNSDTVQDVLLRHGVSAYLSGHLHGAFGRRLHRLHATTRRSTGDCAPAANAAAAAVMGPRAAAAAFGRQGLGTDDGSDDAARRAVAVGARRPVSGPGGHLVELESVDWKYARTLRLLTVDGASGALGFADMSYRPAVQATALAARHGSRTPAGGTSPPKLAPYDVSRSVGSYLPLIVYPPDARYSPQLSASSGSGCTPAAGSSSTAGDAADASNATAAVMHLVHSTKNYSLYAVDLLRAGNAEAGQRVEPGADVVTVCATGFLNIQLHVHDQSLAADNSSSSSTSELRPLHWVSECGFCGGTCSDAGDDSAASCAAPAPLDQKRLEWLILHVPWHRMGRVAFWLQWSVLVVGLLLSPIVILRLQRREQHSLSPASQQLAAGGRAGEWPEAAAAAGGQRTPRANGGASAARPSADDAFSSSVRIGGAGGGSCIARKRSSSSLGNPAPEEAAAAGVESDGHRAHRLAAIDSDDRGDVALASAGSTPRIHPRHSPPPSQQRVWTPWPLRDFVHLADSHRGLWAGLLGYCLYLALGPWFVARFVDEAPAAAGGPAYPGPLSGGGFLTAHGIYMWSLAPAEGTAAGRGAAAQQRWVAAPSQDYVVIINVFMLFLIGPTVLLAASVVARWGRLAVEGRLRGAGQWLSWLQAGGLAGLAALHGLLCWKLWAGLYWAPLLVSPALGWVPLLLAAWLVLARRQVVRRWR